MLAVCPLCFAEGVLSQPQDPSLHGTIGNYTMLGTKKTYRYSFPDALFPFGYGAPPLTAAAAFLRKNQPSRRPSEVQGLPLTGPPCSGRAVVH